MTATQAEFDYEYEFLDSPDVETPDVEVTTEVNAEFAQQEVETVRARQYRKKISRALGNVWRPLIAEPEGLPDACTILMHGPEFAKQAGSLADKDPRARKIIDFITDGAENPYLGVALTGIPLVMQLIRNHEDKLKPEVRAIRIPFTRFGIKLKFGLSLGRLRNITNEPSAIVSHVLTDDKIIAALAKQGITVAVPTAPSKNGRRTAR